MIYQTLSKNFYKLFDFNIISIINLTGLIKDRSDQYFLNIEKKKKK